MVVLDSDDVDADAMDVDDGHGRCGRRWWGSK